MADLSNFFAINVSPPDVWSSRRNVNEFTIWDDGAKRYLNAHQWVAAGPGRTLTDFYAIRDKTIQNNANAVLNKVISNNNGITGLPLEGILKTADSLNASAVEQVYGASEAWSTMKKIISGEIGQETSIYGLDIETFGDVVKGSDVFGITEIGIGKRIYDANATKGVMDQNFGGSFAIGVNEKQREYLQNLIDRFKHGKWDDLSTAEQVSLRRLSRYAGQYSDIFQSKTTSMFGKNNPFIMVERLSNESISLKAFQSGLGNLTEVSRHQNTDSVLKQLITWIGEQKQDSSIFYGANTNFDINGLINAMRYVNRYKGQEIFSSQDIANIAGVKENMLDVVYFVRAIAAHENISVPGLMSTISDTGLPYGASVEDQNKAYHISALTEEHRAAADNALTGDVLDEVTRRAAILEKKVNINGTPEPYFKDIKQFRDLIRNLDERIEDQAFYIERGALDKSHGFEFGIISRVVDENGTKVVVDEPTPNLSIGRQYWRVDMDNVGVFQNGDKPLYSVSFRNIADDITTNGVPTRFVITNDDQTALLDRIKEIINNSTVVPLEGNLDENGFVERTSELGKMALREQNFKTIDDARREYSKLFSPSDVSYETINGTTHAKYGFQGLKDYLQIEDAVRQYEESHGIEWTVNAERFNANNTKAEIDRLHAIINSNDFDSNTKALTQRYFKGYWNESTFTGMRTLLEGDRHILTQIIDAVEHTLPDTADGIPLETLNIERTVLANKMYQASLDILYENYKPYVPNGVELHMDRYGLDFKFKVDDTSYSVQRFNLSSKDNVSKGISSFLERNKGVSITQMVSDFKRRNVLPDSFKFSSSDIDDYAKAQELGAALYDEFINPHTDNAKRIIATMQDGDVSPVTQSSRVYNHTVHNFAVSVPVEDGSGKVVTEPMSVNEVLKKNPTLFSRILDKIQEIQNDYDGRQLNYITDIANSNNSRLSVLKDELERKFLPFVGTNSEQSNINHIINDILFNPEKEYSLANKNNTGEDAIQALFINNFPKHTGPAYQGDSSFMLFFTKKNAGRVIDMVASGEYDEFLTNYNKLVSSEIAHYAVPLELPKLRMLSVSETDAVYSVLQGGNEKILRPVISTYVEKSNNELGRMIVKREEPGTIIYSAIRRSFGSSMQRLREGDIEGAIRTLRRSTNEVLREAPSSASLRTLFTDSRGIVRAMRINSGDALRSSEIVAHEAMTNIFNRMALMTQAVNENGTWMIDGAINKDNLNPIQKILHAFGVSQNMNITSKRYSNDYSKYFKDILELDSWQEFFHSRITEGSLINDEHLGLYLQKVVISETQQKAFNKPILEVMRDFVNSANNAANTHNITDSANYHTLDHYFIMGEHNYGSLVDIFSWLPDTKRLTTLTSESNVEKGVYLIDKSVGSYESMAGLYGVIRPLAAQQNNAKTFNAQETRAFIENNFGVFNNVINTTITTDPVTEQRVLMQRSPAITVGINQIEDTTAKLIESVAKQNDESKVKDLLLNVDEFNMTARVKSMSNIDADIKFTALKSGQARKDAMMRLKTLMQFHGFNLSSISNETMDTLYDAAVNNARTQLGSLYEDKSWLSPMLDSLPVFQDKDSIKLTLETKDLDKQATRHVLEKLYNNNAVIDRDTIIGYRRDGSRIIYNGAPLVFEKSKEIARTQIDALLDTGHTNFRPSQYGDIVSSKIIVNGLEKAMASSIDLEVYSKALGLEDLLRKRNPTLASEAVREQALKLSRDIGSLVFSEVTDGALVAGNYNIAKHGGVVALDNIWEVLTNKYTQYSLATGDSTYINYLKEIANQSLIDQDEKNVVFTVKKINGVQRLVGDTHLLQNPSKFIQGVYEYFKPTDQDVFIPSGFQIDDFYKSNIKTLNVAISSELQELKDTYSFYGRLQAQLMNEHMGKKATIDQRIVQGITNAGGKDNTLDKQLADLIKEYSFKWDGSSNTMFSLADKTQGQYAYEKLQLIQNQFRTEMNKTRASYNSDNVDMKRTAIGIAESLDYYIHPEKMQAIRNKEKNIVTVEIDSLIGELGRQSGNGYSVEDIQNTLFFVNGKPSDYLKKLALDQEVDLLHDSYSIYIDMGEHTFTAKPKTLPGIKDSIASEYKGIVIPIPNAKTFSENEDVIFQNSQKYIASWLTSVREAITGSHNPLGQKAILKEATEKLFENLNIETRSLSKNSDYYKIFQSYVIPTSRSLLGHDETSPYIQELFTHIWTEDPDRQGFVIKKPLPNGRNLYLEKKNLERQFAQVGEQNKLVSPELLGKYRDVVDTIQKNLDVAADQIKNYSGDPDVFRDFSDLKEIDLTLARASREIITDVDEAGNIVKDNRGLPIKKIYHGFSVAISEEGFETSGIRLGDISMSLVSDYQTYLDKGPQSFTEGDLVEKFQEFIGVTADDRIRYVEGEDVAKKVSAERFARIQSQVENLHSKLNDVLSGANISDDIKDSNDIMRKVSAYVLQPIEGSQGEAMSSEEFAITIRSMNENITRTKFRNISDQVYERYVKMSKLFAEYGPAKDYLHENGMKGLFYRYPIFQNLPFSKVFLDPALKGEEVRSLSPLMSLLLHGDHDGDQYMNAIFGNGTGLMRQGERFATIHKAVYERDVSKYFPNLLSDIIRDIGNSSVDDPNDVVKQQSALMEIVDQDKFKKGLQQFLDEYKKTFANDEHFDAERFSKVTVDNIKQYPEIFEAAKRSPILKKVFEDNIESTLFMASAVKAGTVSKSRKDLIGHISTPNYRMREGIGQVRQILELDPAKNKRQLNLLNEVLDDLVTLEVSSGGLFSVTEQNAIDTKWAKDSLTPISIKKYSAGLNSIVKNAGDVERVKYGYINILDAIGAKVLGTNGTIQQHESIADILSDISYESYKDMLTRLKDMNAGKIPLAQEINGYEVSKVMPLLPSLEAIKPLKGLEEAAKTIDDFKSIYSNLAKDNYYSSIMSYFESRPGMDIQTIKSQFHDLGIGDEVIDAMFTRSKNALPFQKGGVYTRTGSLFDLSNEQGLFVYSGNGRFQPITFSGDIDASREMLNVMDSSFRSDDFMLFDRIGSDVPFTLNQLKSGESISVTDSKGVVNEISVGKALSAQTEATRFEKTLNDLIFTQSGNIHKRIFRDPLSSTSPVNTRDEFIKIPGFDANSHEADFLIQRLINPTKEKWRSVSTSLQDSIDVYNEAISSGIIKADSSISTGADLLRQMNNDIANRIYRDLSGVNPSDRQKALTDMALELFSNTTEQNNIGGLFRERVLSALEQSGKDSQEVFDDVFANIQKIRQINTSWDTQRFNSTLLAFRKHLTTGSDDLSAITDIMTKATDLAKDLDYNGLTEESNQIKNFIKKTPKITQQIQNAVKKNNIEQSVIGHRSIYGLFTKNGTVYTQGVTDDLMSVIFNWGDNVSIDKSSVGFGSYIGVNFAKLSVDDKKIIEQEAVALQKVMQDYVDNGGSAPIKASFDFAMTKTMNRLKQYSPNSSIVESALNPKELQSDLNSDILKKAKATWDSLMQSLQNPNPFPPPNGPTPTPNGPIPNGPTPSAPSGPLTKKTLHGSLFDSLSNININPKAVGKAVGALAALGIVNKMLHKKHTSPLDAKQESGEDQPPEQYGQSRRQAPSSVNMGSKNIYVDAPSGIEFRVNASTKRQLMNDSSYGKLINQVGAGGYGTVNVYNDTSGVSDNWLSNKFAELAE